MARKEFEDMQDYLKGFADNGSSPYVNNTVNSSNNWWYGYDQNSGTWNPGNSKNTAAPAYTQPFNTGKQPENNSYVFNASNYTGGYTVPTFDYQYNGWSPSAFSYNSQYAGQLADAVNALQNFSYDPEKDAAYQAYKKQYTNGGKQAMTDTMAKVAARSGGIASSYANTAAAQQYNAYMQQLANKVPELQELAYNKARNNVSTLASLDQDAYTRAYNQWVKNNDWSFDEHKLAETSRYNNALNAYNREMSKYQDTLDAQAANDKYNNELYNTILDTAKNFEGNKRNEYLSQMVDKGYITLGQAEQISDVNFGGGVKSDNDLFNEFIADTGNPTILNPTQYYNAQGTDGFYGGFEYPEYIQNMRDINDIYAKEKADILAARDAKLKKEEEEKQKETVKPFPYMNRRR